jgi:hypothetical chaperone protein
MTPGDNGAWCAIDFGTSNSALAIPDGVDGVRLLALEGDAQTMPTAVFYAVDDRRSPATLDRHFGRAAIAAYIDGADGRLMRSMKSLLGSPLVEQHTDVGGGHAVAYLDVVTSYLRELRRRAELAAGTPLRRAVIGRPVYFVDDDPARDAAAEATLERAARAVGFDDVRFQYEPLAAAFSHESTAACEHLVLVADIGGGTSDFSLVRVGPGRAGRMDRRDDVLANHGVHVAGTDFDRRLALAAVLPTIGHGADRRAVAGEPTRAVPSGLYHDLATWHLINTCYTPARIAEWRAMRGWFADLRLHRRLMTALDDRLGHALLGHAEQAKIDVAAGADARIDLGEVEPGLASSLDGRSAARAIAADQARIVDAAIETLRCAGVRAEAVAAMFFTGGSTGLAPLVAAIAGVCPAAELVRGDRHASVARGLGLHARRVFSAAGRRGPARGASSAPPKGA